MELTKKDYEIIAVVIAVIIVVVLLSRFPLEEPKLNEENEEDFYKNIPDYNIEEDQSVDPEIFNTTPSPEEIPLNIETTTTGCLGEVKDNVFIANEEKTKNKTDEPQISTETKSIKVEFYGRMFCEASKISNEAFITTEGFVTVLETEEIDSDKFTFGPTTSPAEDRTICMCDYKTTVNVTGMEEKKYSVIIENKEGQDWLFESVEVK